MHKKRKKLAQRRAASKSIRSIAREILRDLKHDEELIWEDSSIYLYPWWDGKKIAQAKILERSR